MAQGPHLTLEIKRLITQIHIKYLDCGPTSLRKELLKRMKEIGLDRNFGPDWPGVSAVGKVLKSIRDRETELGPDLKDALWDIPSLANYHVPPEMLPVVLRAWGKALLGDKPLTIRQVQWISRLYYLFKDKDIDQLTESAITYAEQERINRYNEGPSYESKEMWFSWVKDSILYEELTGDNTLTIKCIESWNLEPVALKKLAKALDSFITTGHIPEEA